MTNTLKIKPMTGKRFIAPIKATSGSAAFDIYAQEDIVIKNEKITFDLGFATEIPEGYAAILAPRSGFGTKYGMKLSNTLGLIDSDFRNEWKATLSVSDCDFVEIERGERFLQFFLIKVDEFKIEITESLTETERKGGYGSTGNK